MRTVEYCANGSDQLSRQDPSLSQGARFGSSDNSFGVNSENQPVIPMALLPEVLSLIKSSGGRGHLYHAVRRRPAGVP